VKGLAEWRHRVDPLRNLYGCLPCPRCGLNFRWATQPCHPTMPNTVVCDDCGFIEPQNDINFNYYENPEEER
jgi:predicted RNA-binding Zn-ribbon protein involved in translation (DUF1610 family)